MNTLSWLIYLADVADSVGWAFDCLFFVSMIAGVILAFVWKAAAADAAAEKDKPNKSGAAEISLGCRRGLFRICLPIFLLTFFLSGLVPNKETVYAIAASELGETVLKSDTGNKAVNALNAWLDEQIGGDNNAADTNTSK